MKPAWLIELNREQSSQVFLYTLLLLGVLGFVLHRLGAIGRALGLVGRVMRGSVRGGFRLWERWLSWAVWPVFLALVLAILFAGGILGETIPGMRIASGLGSLSLGAIAVLAYMFIDLERYEVERGYKAVHNPLKGQAQAIYLTRHGQRVRVPLLIAATVAMIGGFSMLNQGLQETVGQTWYEIGAGEATPRFADFLAFALAKLLGVLDVFDLANSKHWFHSNYIRPAKWPATVILTAFKLFFSLVLLQQVFASLRQGKLLAETISDFWSPHGPIHERAQNALAQFGGLAIEPLLISLRSIEALTKEQRDQLPLILATIGPATIPALIRYLRDPHEHVRAIAAASLGRLQDRDTIPLIAALAQDPSDLVRQSAVEAIGNLMVVPATERPAEEATAPGRWQRLRSLPLQLIRRRRKATPEPVRDPSEVAVEFLGMALSDVSAAVRGQAAQAIGQIGITAAPLAPGLINLFTDTDDRTRCQAAEALSLVVGDEATTVAALVKLVEDPSVTVKTAAAKALGRLKEKAAPAVEALVPLLKHADDGVRDAAAEALSQVGPLEGAAAGSLVEGLSSDDNVVRARTAEALGTIGVAVEEAVPALVEAVGDDNDRVRAKAVEALGKMGDAAAEAAVPTLVRALRDQDNWVIALAAEALGQIGESADGAVPALIRALNHPNAQVRANAAEALGRMGPSATRALTPLVRVGSRDEDGGVRSRAVRALGEIGDPTPETARVVLNSLTDPDPLVRESGLTTAGRWGVADEGFLEALLPLIEDANDQVKVEAARVVPRLAGASDPVIEALCRRLLEDNNDWVQAQAALALGQLGPAALGAADALLRAASTGEVGVREQALRAIVTIRPPESTRAFLTGLKDDCGDIRVIASAAWINAEAIPDEAVPSLVEALRDPETRVRANVARCLSRLDQIPADAIDALVECSSDASDGLRMNAILALRSATAEAARTAVRERLADANPRIRLIAADAHLISDPTSPAADELIREALADPTPRIRTVGLRLVELIQPDAARLLETLRARLDLETEPDLRSELIRLIEAVPPPPVVAEEPAPLAGEFAIGGGGMV